MRKRLLLVDPLFQPKGGGPAVTFWALEALKEVYDVTLLAWGPVALEEGNRLFGTSLRPDEFRLQNPAAAVRWMGDLINLIDQPWSVQRWALLMRVARSLAPSFDVVLSTNGETDFGIPGIQYIHYPYLSIGSETWRRPWQIISGFRKAGMTGNHTLANSDWTSAEYRSRYGPTTHTLYPPVPGNFHDVPWKDREDGFVCVGRFSGDKRLDLAIDVLAGVREHLPNLHLHLVGVRMPGEPGGEAYYRHLRQRVEQNADWLFMEENLSRDALLELIAQHRYGFHAKEDEHFGIAVAQLVRAGCITFTHRSGGQVEIIADDRLLYNNQADAIERILAVVGQPCLQEELQNHLASQAVLFSTDRFATELRSHVAAFLEAKAS